MSYVRKVLIQFADFPKGKSGKTVEALNLAHNPIVILAEKLD